MSRKTRLTALALTATLNVSSATAAEDAPTIISQETSIPEGELYNYIRTRELTPVANGIKFQPVPDTGIEENRIYLFANEETGEWLLTSPSIQGKFSIDHRGYAFESNMAAANATPVSYTSTGFNICANIPNEAYINLLPVFTGLDEFNHLVTLYNPVRQDTKKPWKITIATTNSSECAIINGRAFTPYETAIDDNFALLDFDQWPDYGSLANEDTADLSAILPQTLTHN